MVKMVLLKDLFLKIKKNLCAWSWQRLEESVWSPKTGVANADLPRKYWEWTQVLYKSKYS